MYTYVVDELIEAVNIVINFHVQRVLCIVPIKVTHIAPPFFGPSSMGLASNTGVSRTTSPRCRREWHALAIRIRH